MNGKSNGSNNVYGASGRSRQIRGAENSSGELNRQSRSGKNNGSLRSRSTPPPSFPKVQGKRRESVRYDSQSKSNNLSRVKYGYSNKSYNSIYRNSYSYDRSSSPYANGRRLPKTPQRDQIEYEQRRIEYERKRREEARKIAEYKRKQAEMERERRRIEQRLKAERKRRRKKARRIFRSRALICLCIFILLIFLTAGAFALHFFSSPDEKSGGKIEYLYGGSKVREEDGSLAVIDGETYLCFNDMADYLSMAVTGDKEGMKFILHKDGVSSENDPVEESLEFKVGSRTATVCGKLLLMKGECILRGEELWIPVSFAQECLRGVSVTEEKNTVSAARITDEEKTVGNDVVYRDVSLILRGDDALPSVSGEEKKEKIAFLTDMSEYEKYMAPEDSSEYLVLISASSPLDKSYVPGDLTGVENTRPDGRETQQLRLYAAKALEAMFIEMQAAGYSDVTVTSGYRSYDYQSELFESYVNSEMGADPALTRAEAEAKVVLYSSRPGTSEHQSGLCADMHNLESADVSFASTEVYAWMKENAWKFGFVLRYPENKTDVTGIIFEPWHWRFVGRDAALEMYNSAMCLEEYIASKAPLQE